MDKNKVNVKEHIAKKKMLREYYKNIQNPELRKVQEIYHKLLGNSGDNFDLEENSEDIIEQ